MSQQNYIQDTNVPTITDLYPNQLFYFSGFLFYVDGWSWDNVPSNSNISNSGVREGLNQLGLNFTTDSFTAIRTIKERSAPTNVDTISVQDSYLFPELYLIAATCRRYQIYNTWREQFTDSIYPKFLESYSEVIPSKTPIAAGDLTWPLWSGDIQSFTNLPGGRLEVGGYIFTKKIDLQKYTPTSIENSSKGRKIDKGFGEITNSNQITNYYNPINSYIDELSTLYNGWYGVVSLDSTPYVIEAGIGINFDTFIKIESNKIVGFHDDYPQDNISIYGQMRKQYIDS